MTDSTVNVKIHERAGGWRTALVTMDDERRLNCLNSAQVIRLTTAFHALAQETALGAVVLTGAGTRAFVSGADLDELCRFTADGARLYITRLHQACAAIRCCPVPVICRINGVVLGAGLEVAACCDMRVAADDAIFGMPEVELGMPSVIEAALLPQLIGWGRTREMLLTGERFTAKQALQMGLVERVVPPAQIDEVVDKWLDAIGRSAPQAVRAQKALIDRWQRVSLEEGIIAGIDALADAFESGGPQSRIAAFLERKRHAKPRS